MATAALRQQRFDEGIAELERQLKVLGLLRQQRLLKQLKQPAIPDAAVASIATVELRQQRFDATIAELEREMKEIQKKNNVSHVLSVLGRHAQDEEIAVCARGSAKIADDQ